MSNFRKAGRGLGTRLIICYRIIMEWDDDCDSDPERVWDQNRVELITHAHEQDVNAAAR